MSLTQIVTFVLGLVLAVFGLYMIIGGGFDPMHIIVGIVLIVIGLFVLKGGPVTL